MSIEQQATQAMKSLINKLREADKSFTASEHDFLGMRNFINNVTHPGWKQVISESSHEVNIILASIQNAS